MGNIITRRVDLDAIIQSFGPETWALLVLMTTAMGLSILWFILCLSPGIGERWHGEGGSCSAAWLGLWCNPRYRDVVLSPHRCPLQRSGGTVLETEALATQAHILSGRLVQKFRYARRACVATGASSSAFF